MLVCVPPHARDAQLANIIPNKYGCVSTVSRMTVSKRDIKKNSKKKGTKFFFLSCLETKKRKKKNFTYDGNEFGKPHFHFFSHWKHGSSKGRPFFVCLLF